MGRPIDDQVPSDSGDELFVPDWEGDAPKEADIERNRRERSVAHIDADEVYTPVTQEALILLAMAVTRLGGSIVFTREELARPMQLTIDHGYYRETGELRLSAWPAQES
jgi:hypothetical protein